MNPKKTWVVLAVNDETTCGYELRCLTRTQKAAADFFTWHGRSPREQARLRGPFKFTELEMDQISGIPPCFMAATDWGSDKCHYLLPHEKCGSCGSCDWF